MAVSIKIPASLRSCHQMSLGHFKRKSGCRLCATLTPTASDSPDQSSGAKGRPSEKVNEDVAPLRAMLMHDPGLVAALTALPPEGAISFWGGPAVKLAPVPSMLPHGPGLAIC